MMEISDRSCLDCGNLEVVSGGMKRIFFRCKAASRVLDAVSEAAYWVIKPMPKAWCTAGTAVPNTGGVPEDRARRMPKVSPSWKEDDVAVVFRCPRCEKVIEDRTALTFVSGIKAEGDVTEMELCRRCGNQFLREFMKGGYEI